MVIPPSSTPPAYRFADKYTNDEILHDPAKAAQFEDEFVKTEGNYFDICHDKRTGLIYDGVNLNPETGEVASVRNASAPSKECLDLGLLVKAIEGDPKAVEVVGKGDPVAAKAKAIDLMTKKISAYKEFQAQNPGYAGFLPWYTISADKVETASDWKNQIPGLDNGEWMWSMLVAEKALKDGGAPELAAQYGDYNKMLQDNVVKVFYDPQGQACRGNVRIKDPGNPDTGYEPVNPGSYMTGEHGVHEGSMLIQYMTLFGKGLPDGAADHIWNNIHMQKVENPHGTTWQGFWGSAHESWAYMFLPLRDNQNYNDLFRIREEIRSNNAVDRGYPNFGTSTNGPNVVAGDTPPPAGTAPTLKVIDGGYDADSGIEDIGTQPVKHNNVFAVYGVFPMLLQFAQQAGPGNFGLAWLHNALTAPRMQGPLGAGESGTNDGKAFAAVKTTDGTYPTLLAMMGGLEPETAAVLKEKGAYEPFMKRIDAEYKENFGDEKLREPDGFVAPEASVRRDLLGDYNLAK